jgi:hypothetical protein
MTALVVPRNEADPLVTVICRPSSGVIGDIVGEANNRI